MIILTMGHSYFRYDIISKFDYYIDRDKDTFKRDKRKIFEDLFGLTTKSKKFRIPTISP